MRRRLLTLLGLALVLIGPGVVALLARPDTGEPFVLSISIVWLCVFLLLVGTVAAIAWLGEGLTLADVGLGRMGWYTIPSAIALALFFVYVFGPAAHWSLVALGLDAFAAGRNALADLPTWYLGLTVVLVAASEEWLYRGYAIERLQALTGHAWLAGAVSLLIFAIVHVPLWGIEVALTTLVSGAILTALYLWRRDVVFLMLAHVATDLYGLLIAPMR